jgi:2'-5' RNA ligase
MAARHVLWLLPDEDIRARAAALIDALASDLGTPRFAPHVTLLAGLTLVPDEIVARARGLVRSLRPISVTLGAVSTRAEYFKALFVEVEDARLHQMHARAAAAMGVPADPEYRPHLSLLYGEMPAAAKEPLRDRVGRRWDVPCVLEGLSVICYEGPPSSWVTRATLPL